MTKRIDVGVLGATGTVGRRIVRLLQDHPWFRVTELGASAGSAGRAYHEVPVTDGEGTWPDAIRRLILKSPKDDWFAPLVFSALPRDVAQDVEPDLARRGHLVVSNASAFRLDPDVPLIIPEINSDHIQLLERQAGRWPGAIITNPNCSAVGLAMALAPLHRAFGIRAVQVVTLQSLSGAGRPGPAALDLLDNVIPEIAGEEAKIAREPQKILGRIVSGELRPAEFEVSTQVHRVPVLHGHLLAVSVRLGQSADAESVAAVMRSFPDDTRVTADLPSAPARPIEVLEEADRPQPRLDRDRGAGMVVSVGRIRPCPVLHVRFSVLVHNLIRGAAGAALLNGELCHARGITARIRAA